MSSATAASPPLVSIILPTYNRRETVLRAIASVRAQTFDQWELIVVDDGSTDHTSEVVVGLDPRLQLVVQKNQGVAAARNTGLAAARGELIAFLDSDDEWRPYHLQLATSFFAAHPGEHVYSSEMWEDFGDQNYVKHFRVETSDWYPETARRIGSRAFEAPAPEGDPYLRVYERRSPLGAWAHPALDRAARADAHLYRGRIFDCWRWGWLLAMQPTVITRQAMAGVGPNDIRYGVASDFGYLTSLCKAFPVNFVSVPGCIKHELGPARTPLSEGHLVTGAHAVGFHQDVLRYFEELFLKEAPDDPELRALHGFRQTLVARAALKEGARGLASRYLEQAVETFGGAETRALLWMTRLLPQDQLASLAYRSSYRSAALARRIRSALGGVSP